MKKEESVLVKWCGKPWLIATYVLGVICAIITVLMWNDWEMSRKLIAFLTILLPLHVFEENTFPDGFHYMMNIVQKSEQPNAGPMNKLSDMISNFGGEILFILFLIWGGNLGSCILVAFFGIGECIVHTALGILTWKEMRFKGMKTIYGPGILTAYLTLLPVSIYAIRWLLSQQIQVGDIIIGIIMIACVIMLLIRIPIMVFGKFQPEYEFESSGYFKKFE